MIGKIATTIRRWGGALFLLAAVSFSGLAFGQDFGTIVSVHGHTGHIEYADRVVSDRQFLGWGLDFEQSPGLWNWIHYSLPVPWGKKARYIAVRYQTGSIDAFISDIHVYDGVSKIHTESGLNLSEGPDWYIVDMGSDKFIDEALGVSIRVAAGVESMSHRTMIFAVAGDWKD